LNRWKLRDKTDIDSLNSKLLSAERV